MNKAFKICWLGLFIFLGIKSATATQLSGTVTINPAGTASGTVFKNYNSLITYLTGTGSRSDGGPSNTAPFGLSGDLIINVASATITEKVTIPSSTSVTNPINGLGTFKLTFRGASKTGTILQYNTTSTTDNNYVVRLNGSDNVTFQDMTIRASSTVGTGIANVVIHGYGIATNPCNDIMISNCNIIGVSSATSSYSSPIVFNGTTSYTSLIGGGYGARISIIESSISGGYYGLVVRGTSLTSSSFKDVSILNCNFTNSSYYSIYLNYATNLRMEANNISQTNSASISSYGAYLTYCNGWADAGSVNGSTTVIRNNIFSNLGAYGIYCINTSGQSASVPNEVVGNVFLGNFRTSGTPFPMYFSASSFINIAHNSAAVNVSSASSGAFYMNNGTSNKVYNNTFIGYGLSNAIYLGATNTGAILSNNNVFNWLNNSGSGNLVSVGGTTYNKTQLEANSIPQVSNSNISVNQGWASLTNLSSSYSCIKGAPLATAGVSIPSSDLTGAVRNEVEPSIGAYEIGNSQPNFFISKVEGVDQNNSLGPVYDSTSTMTIKAYLHRGNIQQATQYTATLFQNNVPLVQEVVVGNFSTVCDIDTLVFQYHPVLVSGAVTYKVVIDSINGVSSNSIPFVVQSNTFSVGVLQKARIDKSVTLFSQLPISLVGNAPDSGNWVRWRKLSIVPGTLGDSLQSTTTYTGSRGSYHRVSYTISNNLASHTDTFEFYIANCPTGFANDSLILCDTIATLTPGLANSYAWNTGDSTPSITVRQTGMYKVTLFSDSCIVSDSIYVQLNGIRPSYFVIDTLENCPGLGLNLWGTSYSPLITQLGNSGNQFKYLADTGHYQKILINQWGCDSTISLNVLPLNYQELRLDTHACSIDPFFYFQGTIVAVGTDTAYLASASHCFQYYKIGFSWDAKNTDTVTQLATCQNSIQIKPKQFSIFDHIQVFVSSNGDSIFPQDSSSYFTFQAPGTYSIYSFYPYGNSSLSYSPPINIGIPPPPPPPPPYPYSGSACDGTYTIQLNQDTILHPTDTTVCIGSVFQIWGNASRNWDSYLWSNGDTLSVTTVNQQFSGNFLYLTVTNGKETCTDSIQINVHAKVTHIPFDTTIQISKPYSLDVNQYQSAQAQSYNWSNGDQSSTGRIYNSGWNSVTSVFANGCSETDSIFVVFNDGIAGSSNEGRINYQAQIAFGNANRANRTMAVRFSIIHDQITDFAETQTLTTDAKGMIHTLIGSGLAQVGTLNAVSWEDGKIRMLNVEVDTTGQNQWISLGSSRLVSVPYAEYARTSGDGSRNIFAIFDSYGQNLGGSGTSIIPLGNGIFEVGYEKSFQNEPVISIELVGSGNYTKRILFSDAQKCRIEIGGNPNKVHVTVHGK